MPISVENANLEKSLLEQYLVNPEVEDPIQILHDYYEESGQDAKLQYLNLLRQEQKNRATQPNDKNLEQYQKLNELRSQVTEDSNTDLLERLGPIHNPQQAYLAVRRQKGYFHQASVLKRRKVRYEKNRFCRYLHNDYQRLTWYLADIVDILEDLGLEITRDTRVRFRLNQAWNVGGWSRRREMHRLHDTNTFLRVDHINPLLENQELKEVGLAQAHCVVVAYQDIQNNQHEWLVFLQDWVTPCVPPNWLVQVYCQQLKQHQLLNIVRRLVLPNDVTNQRPVP